MPDFSSSARAMREWAPPGILAIRKARGKYIAPLDADDLWFPEKLEKQVACMEQCGNETGLVYCWSTSIDEHGEFVRCCILRQLKVACVTP